MTTPRDLKPLIVFPREDLASEYKSWLNLTDEHDKATLAKAAIALANHGGGFIVIGFEEQNQGLVAIPRPAGSPNITQDSVNGVIRRYAEPEFHCEVHNVPHPATGEPHVVVVVPSTLTVPVMSRRDYPKVIAQNRCYIRKPGPRSEEPVTSEEWRTLLNRCVRANRNDMLESIRGIVSGSVEAQPPTVSALDELRDYCAEAFGRWNELAATQPKDSLARFLYGYYEIGLSLVNAEPAGDIVELRRRLEIASGTKLTGWPIFLEPFSDAKPYGNFIETWLTPGKVKVFSDSSHCDFWRASPDGKLYTIRGYVEDDAYYSSIGQVIDIALPIWHVGEGLLYASRFAETFEATDRVAVFCRFRGLQNRKLQSLSKEYFRLATFNFYGYYNQNPEFEIEGEFTLQQIQDNLAELLHGLLKDFYASFNFFNLSADLVQKEVEQLRSVKSY